MRSVSDKICTENQNNIFVSNNLFSFLISNFCRVLNVVCLLGNSPASDAGELPGRRPKTFFPPSNHAFYEALWKNMLEPDRPQKTIQHGASALHAEWPRLRTHTQNMNYFLLFHGNSGYANALQWYTYIAWLVLNLLKPNNIYIYIYIYIYICIYVVPQR